MVGLRWFVVCLATTFAVGAVTAVGATAKPGRARASVQPAIDEECDLECQFCREHASAGGQCEVKEKVKEKNAKKEEKAREKQEKQEAKQKKNEEKQRAREERRHKREKIQESPQEREERERAEEEPPD
jgi:Skp family chaperone for outer membrane proteins